MPRKGKITHKTTKPRKRSMKASKPKPVSLASGGWKKHSVEDMDFWAKDVAERQWNQGYVTKIVKEGNNFVVFKKPDPRMKQGFRIHDNHVKHIKAFPKKNTDRGYNLVEMHVTADGKTYKAYAIPSPFGSSEQIVTMTPDEFLNLATHKRSPSEESLKVIRGVHKKDLPMDMPYMKVNYKTGRVLSHEGRHRMIVAKELGYTRVPVAIVFAGDDNRSSKNAGRLEPHLDVHQFKKEIGYGSR